MFTKLNGNWKQFKAECLFNQWVMFHSAEEFDDLIMIMRDADVRMSETMDSTARVIDGHRYERFYPCFGKISECGGHELGPFVYFDEIDISDARKFVESFDKARKDKKVEW